MLSVQKARERILSHFQPVATETLSLAEASRRVLAQDVIAGTDLPLFSNSSVDGFAVQAMDLSTANAKEPRTLPVVADIPAGTDAGPIIGPGQAARIMTGAPVPRGADAVVMVEDTDHNDRTPGAAAPQRVTFYKPVASGENVRPRGADVRRGDKVLTMGRRLRPQDLGLLAMLGVSRASIYRRPRLALLSSGNELLPVEAPLAPGKVRDANAYTLAGLAAESGADVIRLGVAADDRESVRGLLERAVAEKADVIVSSAGVSVGAFDFVKDVVESHGSLDFWKVNMRPGKPLAFGAYRDTPFFGLPGNPVSAFVGFLVFVQPALEKLAGMSTVERPVQRVALAEPLESDGRESYLRAIVTRKNGAWVARLTGHQGSGNLLSLVQANALLIIPSGVKSLPLSAEVDAWLL
jgi:molybdopterin molybdotransferase